MTTDHFQAYRSSLPTVPASGRWHITWIVGLAGLAVACAGGDA